MVAAVNFNPVYFLEPASSIAIVLALVLIFRKRGLSLAVFMLAAVSYFSAIAAKVVIQHFTLGYMEASFGYTSVETSLYFGAQTSVLEVLGAYAVVRHWKNHFNQARAGAFGISLAFMENGVLVGGLALVNLTANYLIIAFGQQSLASFVSHQLMAANPSLFYGTFSALPIVGYSILERISSLLVHYSWGFLVVTSVMAGKYRYLLAALPFGLVDSLVPYSTDLGIPLTELILFLISLAALLIALISGKMENKDKMS